MKNKIITNLTLQQYEKKYKNYKKHLYSFTKQEVLDFDKKAGTIGENYVLKNRRWALIDNTYYQLPKPYRKMWFRGLTAAGKMWACIIPIGIVGALGGAGYGVYYLIGGEGIKLEGEYTKYIKLAKAEYNSDGNYEISFNVTSGKRIRSIASVTINGDPLNITYDFEQGDDDEFMFVDNKVVISKLTMQKRKGRIVIEPVICRIDEYSIEDIYSQNTTIEICNVTEDGNLEVTVDDYIGNKNDFKVLIGPSELTKGVDSDFIFEDVRTEEQQLFKITIYKKALTVHSGDIGIIGIPNEQ